MNDFMRLARSYIGNPTNRWTGAAGACFVTGLVRRELNEFAPPGQLNRSAILVMTNIPEATHQFEDLFEADDARVFRITLDDAGIFRLRSFLVVDPSIYGVPDQWTAIVVEPISGKHPKFHKLFHAGSGVDFVESDITEIMDDESGAVIYRRV